MVDKLLTIFINLWVAVVVLLNLFFIFFSFYQYGFFEGWGRISEIYSPFNFINVFVEILSLSPALGAYYLRDRLRKKQNKNV